MVWLCEIELNICCLVKFASPDVLGLLKKFMRQLQAGKTEAERAFIELVIITSVGDFRKFTSSRQVVSGLLGYFLYF
jgi:hypothetical protein